MKTLTVLAVLIVTLFLPVATFAVNLPMTKVAITPATLAEAIAKNDQAVLNQSASDYVATVQKMHPEVGVTNTNDFVEYLNNLELREFPQGKKFIFARVEKTRGQYDIKTFERSARPKERGLYDRNLGKFIASADCGNVMKEIEVPVVEKPAPAPAPRVASPPLLAPIQPAPAIVVVQQPQLQPMPMFSQSPPVNFGRAYEDCPSGSSCGQTAWFAGKIVEAGGFIGGMAVLRPPVTNFANSSSSSATGIGVGFGGSGGQGGTGGHGGNATAGGPVNPNPPPGGGPVNPNP